MKDYKLWRLRLELTSLVFGRIRVLFRLGIGGEA
jgi:hypothetical protein